MYVLPEFPRRDVGTKLASERMNGLRAEDMDAARLAALFGDVASEKLHQKLGFRISSTDCQRPLDIRFINAAVYAICLKATWTMSLAKLGIDSMGIFLTTVFYIITGIICFGVLPLANYPPHVGIVAILSLITAYGLFRKRSWALYPVAMLFLIVTILAVYMIYYLFLADLIIGIGMIAYLILTWIATAYAANRRTKLVS